MNDKLISTYQHELNIGCDKMGYRVVSIWELILVCVHMENIYEYKKGRLSKDGSCAVASFDQQSWASTISTNCIEDKLGYMAIIQLSMMICLLQLCYKGLYITPNHSLNISSITNIFLILWYMALLN